MIIIIDNVIYFIIIDSNQIQITLHNVRSVRVRGTARWVPELRQPCRSAGETQPPQQARTRNILRSDGDSPQSHNMSFDTVSIALL